MSHLRVSGKSLESSTVNQKTLACCNSTLIKISLFVFGLLIVSGAIASHIYQVNTIAVYTMGIVGGVLILATAITSMVQCMSRRSAEKAAREEKIDQLSNEDQSALNELAKNRNDKAQQHFPDNARYIKVDSPSQETLSQLPEWLRMHLLHIPHVIFKNRSFTNYIDNFVANPDLQEICSSPLTLFSTVQGGIGLCMKLHVEPETPRLSTSLVDSSCTIPETETFDIYVLIWKEKEKKSFVLRSETERFIHHRNSLMNSYIILGDRYFYCDENNQNIERIIDVEKHDQLFGSDRHNLVWLLQRLFRKGFFKITTDTDGNRFDKTPNPDRGYWRISLVQN